MEFISTFDLFSIGVGPSSSHTVGPMRAALRFVQRLLEHKQLESAHKVHIDLYGSLALTGKGHGTDRAILMGLEGFAPENVDPQNLLKCLERTTREQSLLLLGSHKIPFDPSHDLHFEMTRFLPYHPNALKLTANDADNRLLLEQIYYSIGGGFILDHDEAMQQQSPQEIISKVPYPFQSGADLLTHCKREQFSISALMMANEKVLRSEEEIYQGILEIWRVMELSIEEGCKNEGILPGGLKVKRRAPILLDHLKTKEKPALLRDPHAEAFDWLSLWSLAVNEENAAGGRIVTAPTNGSAGVIPAVMSYAQKFCRFTSDEEIVRFFLTTAAMANLFKKGASISAAEMGCQGEIGVACSMAAAGLAELMGGSPNQVENAAEIGMEHHLGMTCDPVMGLVQIPCIERNAMGAIKAVLAARLAMHGDGNQRVALDQVIRTMRQTGHDMQSIYKETSLGGLAVNVPEC